MTKREFVLVYRLCDYIKYNYPDDYQKIEKDIGKSKNTVSALEPRALALRIFEYCIVNNIAFEG